MLQRGLALEVLVGVDLPVEVCLDMLRQLLAECLGLTFLVFQPLTEIRNQGNGFRIRDHSGSGGSWMNHDFMITILLVKYVKS